MHHAEESVHAITEERLDFFSCVLITQYEAADMIHAEKLYTAKKKKKSTTQGLHSSSYIQMHPKTTQSARNMRQMSNEKPQHGTHGPQVLNPLVHGRCPGTRPIPPG